MFVLKGIERIHHHIWCTYFTTVNIRIQCWPTQTVPLALAWMNLHFENIVVNSRFSFWLLVIWEFPICSSQTLAHIHTSTYQPTNQLTLLTIFKLRISQKRVFRYYSEVGIFRLRPDLKPQSNSHVYTLENSNSNNSSSSSSVFSLNAYEIVIAKYRYTEAYPFWRQ